MFRNLPLQHKAVCFCFEFLILFPLGGHNFLNSIPFFMIFNVPDAPIKGVQVLFEHQKQQSSPLESGLPWAPKCLVSGWFTLVNMNCNSMDTHALRKGYYYSSRLKMVTKSFRQNKIMQPMRTLSMDWGGPNIFIPGFGVLKGGFLAQEVVLFCLGRFAWALVGLVRRYFLKMELTYIWTHWHFSFGGFLFLFYPMYFA